MKSIGSPVVVTFAVLVVVVSAVLGGSTPVVAQPQTEMKEDGLNADTDATTATNDLATRNTVSTNTTRSCDAISAIVVSTTAELLGAFANCTKVTHPEPPATAEHRTARQFAQLHPGNATVSRYPQGAALVTTTTIADAHVSVYGLHPSTRVRSTENTTTLLIAPSGILRAVVDYRLIGIDAGHNGTDPRTKRHGVESIRLLHNGTVVATNHSATQTPQLEYRDLPRGPAELTVEATIRAVHTTTGANESGAPAESELTVREKLPVVVTDVTPASVQIRRARYPTGTVELAIGHPRWQRLSLSSTNATSRIERQTGTADPRSPNASARTVHNAWRFYTAVDESWTQLTASTATGTTQIQEQAIAPPVYVYAFVGRELTSLAFESVTQPRISGVAYWREPLPSALTSAEQPGQQATRSAVVRAATGVTIRMQASAIPTQVTLAGLVRGTGATIDIDQSRIPPAQKPNLSVTVLQQTESTATLAVSLRDAHTGTPLVVRSESTVSGTDAIRGTLLVDGNPVATDDRGRAIVTVTEYGPHTARFVPGTLTATGTQPAYTATSTTVSWHPLSTAAGWRSLVTTLLGVLLLGLVLLSVSRRLGTILHLTENR